MEDDEEEGSPASWDETSEAFDENSSEHFFRLYAKTRNPLFVWKMIRSTATRIIGQTKDLDNIDFGSVRLPEWCMRYLFSVANSFDALERLSDERTKPTNDDDPEVWIHWRENPTLKTSELLARVPDALGFTRNGSTAFRDMTSYHTRWRDLEDYFDLLDEGVSRKSAIDMLITQWGLSDERAVRRRLSIARQELERPEADQTSD